MLKRHTLFCRSFSSALFNRRRFVRVLHLNVAQKTNHFIF
jgi:hypothetical protein